MSQFAKEYPTRSKDKDEEIPFQCGCVVTYFAASGYRSSRMVCCPLQAAVRVARALSLHLQGLGHGTLKTRDTAVLSGPGGTQEGSDSDSSWEGEEEGVGAERDDRAVPPCYKVGPPGYPGAAGWLSWLPTVIYSIRVRQGSMVADATAYLTEGAANGSTTH